MRALRLSEPAEAEEPLMGGGTAVSTGEDELPRAEREVFARATGRVLYVSLDRYDIQYVVRLLTKVLVCPAKIDLLR